MMQFAPHASQGITPETVPWQKVAQARRLMRQGYDLCETAHVLGVRPRDLDLSLWETLGSEGWA